MTNLADQPIKNPILENIDLEWERSDVEFMSECDRTPYDVVIPFEIDDSGDSLHAKEENSPMGTIIEEGIPYMWSIQYIGLYTQYMAMGLIYGSTGTIMQFCVYVFHGKSNVCPSAGMLSFMSWYFKIPLAIIIDCYHPFGLRRRSWMIFGWFFVLLTLSILAFNAHNMSTSGWLTALVFMQGYYILQIFIYSV